MSQEIVKEIVDARDAVIKEIRDAKHSAANGFQKMDVLIAHSTTAFKQTDELHGIAKTAQGMIPSFASVPKDLSDIRMGLLTKATDRTGIPASIVMQLFLLYTIAVAIPIWLPILVGTNTSLNLSRDGVAIVTKSVDENSETGKR